MFIEFEDQVINMDLYCRVGIQYGPETASPDGPETASPDGSTLLEDCIIWFAPVEAAQRTRELRFLYADPNEATRKFQAIKKQMLPADHPHHRIYH